MAKITKQQIQKINNMCSNDWQLDLEYFLYHGEKQLMKCIDLDEGSYLKFTLCYNSQNQIVIYISKFYHKKGDYFAHSHGLGKRTIIEPTQAKRKNLNKLIEYTNRLNNETLLDINTVTPVSDGGGIFVPSENF